jgi:hypothetical protein
MAAVDEKVCEANHKAVDKIQSDQHERINCILEKLDKATNKIDSAMGKFDKIYIAIIVALIAVVFDFIRGLMVLSKVSNHIP